MLHQRDRQEKQRWYSQLLHYAHSKNHRKGWAYYQYKAKFGAGPGKQIRSIAMPPSSEILGWIKHRNIAWRKSPHNPANAGDQP